METFKYYGRDVDPDRKLISTGDSITQEQKNEHDLKMFRTVFRSEVRKAIVGTAASDHGLYARLPPQEGAFDHLMLFIEAAGYKLNEIMISSVRQHDALFKIQITVPINEETKKKAFSQPIPESAEGCVFVSFHAGLSAEASALVKKNAIIEAALADVEEAFGIDPNIRVMFDPEVVVPDLIKAMRCERRYRYLATFTADVAKDHYFKTPEGFIYRVEIEGYAAVEEMHPQTEVS